MPEAISFPEKEEKILKFWKKNKIFEKSIEQRSENNPASFYDGPPFVTGVPHYGHLLGSIAKDIIPRYLAMKGKRVRRVWGWDCHGLPIENKVEQKLGLKDRRDIEKIGLLKFINECKDYVSQTSAEWNWYIDRIGRWVDMDNAYKTMDLTYMESVIWVFKKLYDQDLIYKGMRISLFCPRCSTPISNFEIAMDNSYQDREDTAVTLKFKIINQEFLNKYKLKKPCYLLAWTTTPWSCVSVMGLAVGEGFNYQIIETDEECYLIAKNAVEKTMTDLEYKIIGDLTGKEIAGLSYEHLFDYYNSQFTGFKTYSTSYVSQEEGTGIVTINGAFGDVDMDSSKKYNLPIIVNVDEEGKFTPEVKVCPGIYVKDAQKLIIDDLKERNLLFKEEKIIHSYPFCYRCETPLIYRAQDSWFISIEKLRQKLLDKNQDVHWVPKHFKEGRFSEGIKTAPDWCISRTRYWATAMPVWECQQCENREVFGSIADIEKRSGQKVKDLHRPFIDEIVFKCLKCDNEMKRVKEVLDCWLDSGSMPYAERHYPFENKEDFEKSFPADYISEYTGQVRAWFYVLHVLGVALFDSNCFKNVVVSGVIMGTDGRKMSKSFHNYPDPKGVLEKYGGDALRLYLMGSPTMSGQDMNISEEGIKEQVKKINLIYWNCYNYFKTFADFNAFDFKKELITSVDNLLDLWILSRANRFLKDFASYMDNYHIPESVRLVPEFLDDLSRWYIRRSRDRLRAGDKKALSTLYRVLILFTKTAAPLIPFLTEEIYKSLSDDKESVHLEDWPEFLEKLINSDLEEKMAIVRSISTQALAERAKMGIKIRQPLSELKIKDERIRHDQDFLNLIKEEVNVKEVIFDDNLKEELWLNPEIDKKLKQEGLLRELIRNIQQMRKLADLKPGDKITIGYSASEDDELAIEKDRPVILKETFAKSLEAVAKNSSGFDCQKEMDFDKGKLWLGIKKV
ncbi:isoleucine--tRNA ligase [Candidatus Parcubacteria bacterium]|nr:isoleucine--tRNA ligase [Patescibacteria group bacterium]MBU4466698.1 isoleucine--tRNA ligase [Patescibacteria group bacterium]MCG2688033.1 isoleucine--tRNA ligase [Candidatus Parcubacteria bacterium]